MGLTVQNLATVFTGLSHQTACFHPARLVRFFHGFFHLWSVFFCKFLRLDSSGWFVRFKIEGIYWGHIRSHIPYGNTWKFEFSQWSTSRKSVWEQHELGVCCLIDLNNCDQTERNWLPTYYVPPCLVPHMYQSRGFVFAKWKFTICILHILPMLHWLSVQQKALRVSLCVYLYPHE